MLPGPEEDDDCDKLWSMFDVNDLDEEPQLQTRLPIVGEPDCNDMLSDMSGSASRLDSEQARSMFRVWKKASWAKQRP